MSTYSVSFRASPWPRNMSNCFAGDSRFVVKGDGARSALYRIVFLTVSCSPETRQKVPITITLLFYYVFRPTRPSDDWLFRTLLGGTQASALTICYTKCLLIVIILRWCTSIIYIIKIIKSYTQLISLLIM